MVNPPAETSVMPSAHQPRYQCPGNSPIPPLVNIPNHPRAAGALQPHHLGEAAVAGSRSGAKGAQARAKSGPAVHRAHMAAARSALSGSLDPAKVHPALATLAAEAHQGRLDAQGSQARAKSPEVDHLAQSDALDVPEKAKCPEADLLEQ